MSGIGNYELTHFDSKKKEATMVSSTPYPSKFDEGIIAQIVRNFKPAIGIEKIQLDTTKEQRKQGAESCTYLISW